MDTRKELVRRNCWPCRLRLETLALDKGQFETTKQPLVDRNLLWDRNTAQKDWDPNKRATIV